PLRVGEDVDLGRGLLGLGDADEELELRLDAAGGLDEQAGCGAQRAPRGVELYTRRGDDAAGAVQELRERRALPDPDAAFAGLRVADDDALGTGGEVVALGIVGIAQVLFTGVHQPDQAT